MLDQAYQAYDKAAEFARRQQAIIQEGLTFIANNFINDAMTPIRLAILQTLL